MAELCWLSYDWVILLIIDVNYFLVSVSLHKISSVWFVMSHHGNEEKDKFRIFFLPSGSFHGKRGWGQEARYRPITDLVWRGRQTPGQRGCRGVEPQQR